MINHPALTRWFFSIPNSEVCCWRTPTCYAPKFGDMSSMKIISLTRLHSHLEVVNYHTIWGPQSIAFSWFISGLIVVYGRYNELVHGDYISCFINQCSHHWGAPSCTYHVKKKQSYKPNHPVLRESCKVPFQPQRRPVWTLGALEKPDPNWPTAWFSGRKSIGLETGAVYI